MVVSIPSLVRIKRGALARLGLYLQRQRRRRVGVFWGEGVQSLFNDQFRGTVAENKIDVAHEQELTTISAQELQTVHARMPRDLNCLVAIGGGRVIDAAKYVSSLAALPLISVPTIVSNDGFCSPMSSLEVEGKRRTMATRIPDGVVIDLDILVTAPRRFVFSGIGDLVCKITAIHDWKLAFHRTGESVEDFAVLMADKAVQSVFRDETADLGDVEFLRSLAGSLLLSGVAMSVAGSTRPASGSEHLISHAYDELAPGTSLHGLQVGVATYAVSLLQESTAAKVRDALDGTGFIDFMSSEPLSREAFRSAIERAPSMKENFHTVLSEPNAVPRLLSLIDSDAALQKMLR